MKTKAGVRIDKLCPELGSRLDAISDVMEKWTGSKGTITSGHEGYPGDRVHKPTSRHYIENNKNGYGCAIDLRVWNLRDEDVDPCIDDLYDVCDPRDFDILFETNHIHLEYDPVGVKV